MRLTEQQRVQIVKTAKAWIGTLYHHRAAVKGAGADCAMFPLAVYRECGLVAVDYEPPEYSSQWHLHRSEERYLAEVEKFAVASFGPPLPADFVVFKFGRTFSHGAIVIDWPIVIHSYIPHGVTLADAMSDPQLMGREMRVYEIVDWVSLMMETRRQPGQKACMPHMHAAIERDAPNTAKDDPHAATPEPYHSQLSKIP